MDYEKRKHNRPISVVIKGYLDKSGGKVTESRNEIEWRFKALDWHYQKQILFAFLQSGKSDRDWAYRKLFVFWDDCFIPILQELWEKYHDERLTWLIIRYFPIEFLKRNYEKLNVGRNYYFLCSRMFDDKDFVVDKTQFNEYDLLRIKRVLGESVIPGDAEDMFFLLVYKYCKGAYNFRAFKTMETYGDTPVLYLLSSPRIQRMLNNIVCLGCDYFQVTTKLREWIGNVTNDFLIKYEKLSDQIWFIEEDEISIRELQKTHCYAHIDPKYTEVWDKFDCHNQQLFLDYLEERHKEHVIEEAFRQCKSSMRLKPDEYSENDVFEFLPSTIDLIEDDSFDLPF